MLMRHILGSTQGFMENYLTSALLEYHMIRLSMLEPGGTHAECVLSF